MRAKYHEQMSELHSGLGHMCALAGTAMRDATRALLEADLAAAESVITGHGHIVHISRHAEEQALTLLALQAPVAGDLRAIVSNVQIVADIERMGGLALHVAKVARLRHPGVAVPDEVSGYFSEMGQVAVGLADNAREVLISQDPEAALCMEQDDDAMDDLHRHLFAILLDREWNHPVPVAVDITLLGRFYERFADHAVLIGRRVVFQATGQTPEQYVGP
jgi:phosphate transport system protein